MPHFIPNSLPTFDLRPLLVVGMPLAFAIFLLTLVTPRALFQLKDSPGIFIASSLP